MTQIELIVQAIKGQVIDCNRSFANFRQGENEISIDFEYEKKGYVMTDFSVTQVYFNDDALELSAKQVEEIEDWVTCKIADELDLIWWENYSDTDEWEDSGMFSWDFAA